MNNRNPLLPLFKTTVGFDRLFDQLSALAQNDKQSTYPPYNIEVLDEHNYAITIAVAGFRHEDLELSFQPNRLIVRGNTERCCNQCGKTRVTNETAEEQACEDSCNCAPRHFLHQGIAERAFERSFHLSEHVQVNAASLADGLLTIRLELVVPEAKKPRSIPIQNTPKGASLPVES